MDVTQDILKSFLDPLASIGQAERALDSYANLTHKYANFEAVDPRISSFELDEDEREGDVLLPLIHTQGTENYAYGALAHAFRTRGYRPVVPICFDDLHLCLRKQNERDSRGTCELCHHSTTAFLDAFNISPYHIADVLGEEYEPPDPETWDVHSVVYRDVDVSNYARATLRRYFTKRLLDYEDPHVYESYIRFLKAGLTLVDLAYALHNRFDLQATVGQHVPYLYGGVLLEVSERLDVPAVSFEVGYYKKGTFLFGNVKNKLGFPAFTDMETLQERVQHPLSEAEREQIDRTMKARYEGQIVSDYYNYTKGADDSVPAEDGVTLIGMFTNLLWDASLIGADIAFSDPFEWVVTTIDYFRNRDDVRLVVKPHPAEAHRNTHDKMADWLRENVAPIPENVIVLEADTTVNPYQLMHDIDVGIVYNSTLGLEMAYSGVPVVVVGETHYRDLGFVYDTETREEYMDFLSRVDELSMDDEMHTRARRYAYYLFEERMIEMPFLTDDDRDVMAVLSHDHLKPGTQPLDTVVDQILADERAIAYDGG